MKKKRTTKRPTRTQKTVHKLKVKANTVRKIVRTTQKKTQKMAKDVVDQALIKISPQLKSQLDKMSMKVQKGDWNVNDLKFLGLRILDKAQEISQSIKKQNKTKKK